MQYYFYYRGDVSKTLVRINGNIEEVPNTFESIMIDAMKTQKYLTVNEILCDNYAYDKDYKKDFYKSTNFALILLSLENVLISQDKITVKLARNSPHWDQLFNSIRNVKELVLLIEREITNYDWLDHVEYVSVHEKCTPELYNSEKITYVVYEPWMDVKKYPNIIYRFNNVNDIDPYVKFMEIRFDCLFIEEVLQALAKLEHLKFLAISVAATIIGQEEYFKNINTEVLSISCYGNIDSVVALDKYSQIISNSNCSKEVVDNTRYLIDGKFNVDGVDNSKEYLKEIFARNKKYLNTKSANKY